MVLTRIGGGLFGRLQRRADLCKSQQANISTVNGDNQ